MAVRGTSGAGGAGGSKEFFEPEDGNDRGTDDATERRGDPGEESGEEPDDDESAALDSLFGDEDDDDAGDEDRADDDDDAEDEEDPKARSSERKGLLKRLSTLSARKRHFEGAAKKATTELETANTALKGWQDLYPGDKGLANAKADKSFMDALERNKNHPTVRAAIDLLISGKAAGPAAELDRGPKRDTATSERAERDPAVETILRRDAERTVSTLLQRAKVRPELRRGIARDVVKRLDFKSGAPSDDDVSDAVRDSIRENGYSRDFLTGKGDRRRNPPTGGGRGAATVFRGERGGSDRDEEKAPKTQDERMKRAGRRLAAALGGRSR
jgi:hypothetical protein